MCLFHKRSKWKEYSKEGEVTPLGILYPKQVRGKTFDYAERRQMRYCLKCGLKQDRKIDEE